MKKRTQHRLTNQRREQTRLAATVATSAVSLVLLTAAQNPLLAQAPAASAKEQQEPRYTKKDALNKYFAQGYNYCDAKVLAAFWGESNPGEAKERLGNKMLQFGPKEGQVHIREARAQALQKPETEMPCWYADDGYTYDDAVLLGKYWGCGLESKNKMTRMIVEGKDAQIKAALKAAKAGKDAQ